MARWNQDQDGGKEAYWRSVVQHRRHSGQSVRSYCLRHGLSEPSFYAWRRTIQERDRQAARSCQQCPATRDAAPPFVPVTVMAPAPALEVVLGDGRTIRVPAGFDAATLQRLLAVLDEAPSC
jgi:transposase-like protein